MTTRNHSRRNTSIYETREKGRGDKDYIQYSIGQMRGKGGFASVYEITNKAWQGKKAVKIMVNTDKKGNIDLEKDRKVQFE